MAGTLFVVATPIGNLEDITLRALRVLREASLVAAEDTRRTGHLLAHYQIKTKLISVHEHNERARVPQLLARLAAGESIALVTDAGTPGASDPGMDLVAAAREQGYRVEAIPGPSAVIAALSVAGEPFDRFSFAGFPPVRGKDRKKWLADVAATRHPVVFFEAPHRVESTLAEMAQSFGDRPITICRELTKLHEEVAAATVATALQSIKEVRGEFTFVLGSWAPEAPVTASNDGGRCEDRIVAEFGRITESRPDLTRREQVRAVAESLGLKVSLVYAAIEQRKNMSSDQI